MTARRNWSLYSVAKRFRRPLTPWKGARPGSAPVESTGLPLSFVRQPPIASKFSSANPKGSIGAWHAAQVGFLRCSSSRSRTVRGWAPATFSLRAGTFGGGAGGGEFRKFSSSHFPRNTGDVLLGYEVTVRRLPCPSSPPRESALSKVTLRKRSPYMPGIL